MVADREKGGLGYVEQVLQPGEDIKHVSRLHWIVYLPGLLFIVVGLLVVGLIGLISLTPNQSNPIPPVLIGIVLFVVLFVGSVSLFQAWFKRWTTEIAVTNRRIIYKRGFIRRHTIEMNMDKIESVDVDQSITGRLFGFGTITVHGTGTGIEPLYKIDSPIAFRNNVTAL